jgi:hypothetical protein
VIVCRSRLTFVRLIPDDANIPNEDGIVSKKKKKKKRHYFITSPSTTAAESSLSVFTGAFAPTAFVVVVVVVDVDVEFVDAIG